MARQAREWGSGTPPIESIVRAALEIVDDEGLAALSTRRLATELDMYQPNLYRRIADRQELLDLVADTIIAEAGLPAVARADWREWLSDCGLRIWRTWQSHPHAVSLMMNAGGGPAIIELFEAIFAVFLDGGFDPRDVGGACSAYLGFVFGTSMLDAMGLERLAAGEGRRPVAAGVNHPHVAWAQRLFQVIGGQPPEDAAALKEQLFRDGLEAVLDGLAVRRESRQG